ncbi:Panacea domain-containing protein [Desulfothermus naphthae]
MREIIRYICDHYPYQNELSKARLTKLVYLADWKAALKYGKQLTNITWFFNYYGPYVEDVFNEAKEDPHLEIKRDMTIFGDPKTIIISKKKSKKYDLTEEEIDILKEVIEETKSLYWDQFVDLIYSTYPVKTQDKFSVLDLVKSAKEKKQLTNRSRGRRLQRRP